MQTQPYYRLDALDLARGFAVLAILLVNIWAFAMPMAAYANPAAYGDLSGLNRWVWLLSYVLVQEKFITVFSVLFGAGVALFVDHAKARAAPVARLHFRRMSSLLLVGLLHAYGLWSGDILTAYALLGMLLLVFLGRGNAVLLYWAMALFSLSILLMLSLSFAIAAMSASDLQALQQSWLPPAAQLQIEIDNYRAGWWQQMASRIPTSIELQTMLLSFYSVRLLAHMLLGVWLYRSGFFAGNWPLRWYRLGALLLLPSGLLLAWQGAQQHLAADFAVSHSLAVGALWNNIGSLLAALGYLALFVLWSRSTVASAQRRLLQQAGRMAFSLYLGSSVLCTSIFYGHGLGLFGQLDRVSLLAVVLGVWLLLLLFAHFWLRRYRQGPLEALWRLCTYGKNAEAQPAK